MAFSYTGLSPSMADLSRSFYYPSPITFLHKVPYERFPAPLPLNVCGPATPGSPFELPVLGFSEFARHYYRNHGCFLFLWVLRWFTSPGSPRIPMYSECDNCCSQQLGF